MVRIDQGGSGGGDATDAGSIDAEADTDGDGRDEDVDLDTRDAADTINDVRSQVSDEVQTTNPDPVSVVDNTASSSPDTGTRPNADDSVPDLGTTETPSVAAASADVGQSQPERDLTPRDVVPDSDTSGFGRGLGTVGERLDSLLGNTDEQVGSAVRGFREFTNRNEAAKLRATERARKALGIPTQDAALGSLDDRAQSAQADVSSFLSTQAGRAGQELRDNPAALGIATGVAAAEPTPVGEAILFGSLSGGAAAAGAASGGESESPFETTRPSELPLGDPSQDTSELDVEDGETGGELGIGEPTTDVTEVPADGDALTGNELELPERQNDTPSEIRLAELIGRQRSRERSTDEFRPNRGASDEELDEIFNVGDDVVLGEEEPVSDDSGFVQRDFFTGENAVVGRGESANPAEDVFDGNLGETVDSLGVESAAGGDTDPFVGGGDRIDTDPGADTLPDISADVDAFDSVGVGPRSGVEPASTVLPDVVQTTAPRTDVRVRQEAPSQANPDLFPDPTASADEFLRANEAGPGPNDQFGRSTRPRRPRGEERDRFDDLFGTGTEINSALFSSGISSGDNLDDFF